MTPSQTGLQRLGRRQSALEQDAARKLAAGLGAKRREQIIIADVDHGLVHLDLPRRFTLPEQRHHGLDRRAARLVAGELVDHHVVFLACTKECARRALEAAQSFSASFITHHHGSGLITAQPASALSAALQLALRASLPSGVSAALLHASRMVASEATIPSGDGVQAMSRSTY